MSNNENNNNNTVSHMVDEVINEESSQQHEEQHEEEEQTTIPVYREETIELEDEMIQQETTSSSHHEEEVNNTSEDHYHEKKEKINDEETVDEKVERTEPIAEPSVDNIRVSIEKSDISSSVVGGAGDPKPIRVLIPLIAAILNFVYAVIFLILSFVEIKLTIDFVQDYHAKYDKNEDYYEDNGYLEDDQVSLFSGISVFCLVIAALMSLFGATCGLISCIMIIRKEFFFGLLKTHKNYINTILVLACMWLFTSIVSLVPFSGIYLVLDFAVQFGTHIGFDWWALVVVLIGAIFVGFAGLLLKRIWEFRAVYVQFGTL
ncbi:predicted protein [Naegleria gruberi]|uniref:Predicted protein n=1 Tax=Naegleria gruberi TaxID=5762 RepID=D2VWZ6_NAEGR|nr:uncharacterized protein NAEGRDRAFT_73560 [Naegleria gruberi]EFC38777.1 predicted protein [Naegleria gruberi]|eukprot:XP_002671521.1 predicted protein [Naegleria gruberi strain NEG-M]